MSNEIRINTSISVLQDVGGSAGAQEGISYTNKQHDGNANSRTWGGKYGSSHTAYDDDAVAYYDGVVVSQAAATNGMDGHAWTEATDVTDGTKPVTVEAVAVEYTAELGTVGNVHVTVSGEILATLDLGDGIVIPLKMGEALADIKVHADVYANGVNEATVNVLLVGQNA